MMSRINKTRYALLGFLSMHPASGYDIKKHMQQSTDHFWREGDSSIYPILKQLLDEGMVLCELSDQTSAKTKKIYTITEDGQQSLEAWLYEAPALAQGRNELLLKLFFGWHVERAIIIKHLQRFRDHTESVLAQYNALAQATPSSTTMANDKLHRYLTLKAGIIHNQASLVWCDEAIGLLQDENR